MSGIDPSEAATLFVEGFRAGLKRAAEICRTRAEAAMTTHDDCTNAQDRMLLMRTARAHNAAADLITGEVPA